MEFTKVNDLVREVLDSPKIETKDWEKFKLSDLFECDTAEQQLKVEESENGFPYVSRSAFNNGITKFVKKIESKVNKANCITIGAEGYYAFFQANDFMAGNKVYVLRNKNINKWNGLFICSLLNSIVGRYSYNDARILQKIRDEVHMFPVDKSGQPDWEYMEKYIRERERDLQKPDFTRLEKLPDEIKHSEKIDVSGWKEFPFVNRWIDGDSKIKKENKNGIFELCATKSGIDNNKLVKNGEEKFNFITRTDKCNGISKQVSLQNKPIDSRHSITIGLDTQTVFYQKSDFYTGQNINIIRHKKLENMYVALFVIGAIKGLIKSMFTWGSEGATLGRLAELNILLPSKGNEPDWEYMEKVAKSRYDYFCKILLND